MWKPKFLCRIRKGISEKVIIELKWVRTTRMNLNKRKKNPGWAVIDSRKDPDAGKD